MVEFPTSRVVYRSNNNANSNGGVSYANANNDSSNTTILQQTRLQLPFLLLKHLFRVSYDKKIINFCLFFLFMWYKCYAFAYTKLIIPITVKNIDNYAFSYTGLKDLTVLWPSPIVINNNIFEGVNLSKSTLKVPIGTKELYKATLGWLNFGTIEEL